MVLLESTNVKVEYDDFVDMLKLKSNSKTKMFITALENDDEEAHSQAYEYYEKILVAMREQKSANRNTLLVDYAVECLRVYGETYPGTRLAKVMANFSYEEFINTVKEYISNNTKFEKLDTAVYSDDNLYDLKSELTNEVYKEFIEEEVVDSLTGEEDDYDYNELCKDIVYDSEYLDNILRDLNQSSDVETVYNRQIKQSRRERQQLEDEYWKDRL